MAKMANIEQKIKLFGHTGHLQSFPCHRLRKTPFCRSRSFRRFRTGRRRSSHLCRRVCLALKLNGTIGYTMELVS